MTTTTPAYVLAQMSPAPATHGEAEATAREEERTARLLRAAAIAVLIPVAVVGAVLSFDGLHSRARAVFTDPLAYGFPLLVDALILGCTLAYLAGAKVGRPRGGWRLAAHAGIAGTVALNAAAATSWAAVPWHITAPIVWSVLVELTGKELLGEWRAAHAPVRASIPARLWLTAPVESARTWLRIARRLDGEQTAARLDVGVHAAAVHALALAVPGWRNRRVRRILRRQLRAGSLSPLAILGPLGWTDDTTVALARVDGPAVLRAALRDAIRAAAPTSAVAADAETHRAASQASGVQPAGVVAGAAETYVPHADTQAWSATDPIPAAPVTPGVGGARADEPGTERAVPAQTPTPAGAVTLDFTDHSQGLTKTGDRGCDAVAVLTVHGRDITYHQLAEHLTALGWAVPAGASTRQRILTDARRAYDAARGGLRLAGVR